ncbi:MAG: hypothetical protein LW847_16560 [Burkholderiales bacterium]|jgi:hypothetical protein|nr:hypothetical protein [Burkholderiales bacterium]
MTVEALSALELAKRGYRRTRRGLWVASASGHYGPTMNEAVIDEALGLAALRIFQDLMVLEIDGAVRLAREFPGARYGSGRYGGSRGTAFIRVPVLYHSGKPTRPARILAGALPWERVHYRNGNTFDLRAGNLLVWPQRPAQVPADGPAGE